MNHSPGSYVFEEDRSQRVRAISTSIGAIVGPSAKGPIMKPTLVTNKAELEAYFGKPNFRFSRMHYAALTFLEEASQLWVVRVVNDDESRGARPLTAGAVYTVDDNAALKPRPALNVFDDGSHNPLGVYDPYNTFTFNPNTPGVDNMLFMLCAIDPGTWNNELYIEVAPSFKAGLTDFDERYDNPYVFWINVYVNYKNPRSSPVERFLVSRSKEVDGNGNQLFLEDVINKASKYIRVRNNELAPLVKVIESAKVYLNGGTNGTHVSFGQMVRGWDLFSDPEESNVNLLIQGGAPVGMTSVQDICDIQRKMDDVAQDRGDAISLLDVPREYQETSEAVAYALRELNLDSSYSAIYTGEVLVPDTDNGVDVWVPISGYAAAACARCDNDAAVWFSPAGIDRGGLWDAKQCLYRYGQGHRDALFDARVNPVRYFPKGFGFKLWGSETMQFHASALSDINVRRLINMIKRSIQISNLQAVFDPNSVTLRSYVTSVITRFLEPIHSAGGLYWYGVVCDETNNTPDTISSGNLIIEAYFDPVITAKRVNLRVNLMATGATYQEYLSDAN